MNQVVHDDSFSITKTMDTTHSFTLRVSFTSNHKTAICDHRLRESEVLMRYTKSRAGFDRLFYYAQSRL